MLKVLEVANKRHAILIIRIGKNITATFFIGYNPFLFTIIIGIIKKAVINKKL
jgi:hypothetical protein